MWNRHYTIEEKKVLDWGDFPANPPEDRMIPQIAAYMRRTLEKYEDSEFIKYLVLPSPTALSGFFQCTEEDILAALQELERQGYEYETAGKSGPITLWDPLIRRKPAIQDEPGPWQVFYDAIFNPIRRPLTS